MNQRNISIYFFVVWTCAIAILNWALNFRVSPIDFGLDRLFLILQKFGIFRDPTIIFTFLVMVSISLSILAEIELRKKNQSMSTLIIHLLLVFFTLMCLNVLLHGAAVLSLGLNLPASLPGALFLPASVLWLYGPLRIWFWQPPAPRQDNLERGIKVVFDAQGSVKAMARKSADLRATGVAIHQRVRLPMSQESKHILLIAAPGGGKTQVIYPLIEEIRMRGDGLMLYDFKGDYTAAFGEDPGVTILSPFDQRGLAWDIAEDITTEIKAMELAASLIPDGNAKEPFFKKAAQDLLTGVITSMIAENPGQWDIGDLITVLSDKSSVVDACQKHRPGALTAIGPIEEKQASGVFGELRTGSIQLEFLAQAWPTKMAKVSLSRWVRDPGYRAEHQVLILRGNQQYRMLDGFLTALLCSLLVKESLSLPDSYERRIWAILDEFGNLPKIEAIDALLTGVRSKGVRIVAAIQDIAQIEGTYSKAFAQTFFNCFGTVLAGLCSGATASYLSNVFGKNKIERQQHSKSRNVSVGSRGTSRSESESNQMVIEPALLDTDFSSLSSPSLTEPAYFWLRIAGWPIGKLAFPVHPLPSKYPPKLDPSWIDEPPRQRRNPTLPMEQAAASETTVTADLVRQYQPRSGSLGFQTESNNMWGDADVNN
jgi:hypothetical protein